MCTRRPEEVSRRTDLACSICMGTQCNGSRIVGTRITRALRQMARCGHPGIAVVVPFEAALGTAVRRTFVRPTGTWSPQRQGFPAGEDPLTMAQPEQE